MGSGKTSVGKALAHLSHHLLIDSDQEIENRTGVDIPWIFEVEGEPGFRKREAEIIAQLSKLNGIILSIGGGAVISPITRQNLAQNGIVIYLRVSLEKQIKRIMTSKHSRPMLKKHDTQEKLAELNRVREPLYREIADLTYETDLFKPNELAENILQDVQQYIKKIKN
jgi:shikimate kinase